MDEHSNGNIELIEREVKNLEHTGAKETLLNSLDSGAGKPLNEGPAQTIQRNVAPLAINRLAASVILDFLSILKGSFIVILANAINTLYLASIPQHVDPQYASQVYFVGMLVAAVAVCMMNILFRNAVQMSMPDGQIFPAPAPLPYPFNVVNQ